MEFRTSLSFAEAKEYDLVNYLQQLGHQPAKIKEPDYWYHSPLRQENTPSFKVNRNLNRWYDHGIGWGGNIIDFAVLYFSCSPVETLAKISGSAPAGLLLDRNSDKQKKVEAEKKIKVVKDSSLHSFSLCRYLLQRKILLDIAGQYCREINYELNGKTYFAIGFKNDLDGYELRNAFVKLSSAPKGLTTIQKWIQKRLRFRRIYGLPFLPEHPKFSGWRYEFCHPKFTLILRKFPLVFGAT